MHDSPLAGSDRSQRVLGWLTVVVVAVSVAVLAVSLFNPLFEQHGFRQSQTALSAWWMLHGGPWIDYWTPVLGPPWSMPFEFPLYQWLIAVLAGWTPLPLNAAGRVVSYAWLWASLPPALALLRAYRLPPLTGRFYVVLLLAAPVYLFWGRAVMIETQALALSLWFLWWLRAALERVSLAALAGATLAGVGASLTKVTTLGPFLLAAAAMVLHRCAVDRSWRARGWAVACGAVAVLPGLVLFALWNRHADALKALNPLTVPMRSAALNAWTFGPLSERFSAALLIANARALVDIFGLVGPILLVPLGWHYAKAARTRRTGWAIAALVALYLVPWFVLTNLQIIHNYYQTANALMLVAAAAVALAAIAEAGRRETAVLLCVAFVASQYLAFAGQYGRSLFVPDLGREAALTAVIRAHTPPGSAIQVYGLDWSPVVAYEAERVALMEPKQTTAEGFRGRLPVPHPAAVGGHPLAAVIRCPSQVDDDPVGRARLDAVARWWPTVRVEDCRVSFPPLAPR